MLPTLYMLLSHRRSRRDKQRISGSKRACSRSSTLPILDNDRNVINTDPRSSALLTRSSSSKSTLKRSKANAILPRAADSDNAKLALGRHYVWLSASYSTKLEPLHCFLVRLNSHTTSDSSNLNEVPTVVTQSSVPTLQRGSRISLSSSSLSSFSLSSSNTTTVPSSPIALLLNKSITHCYVLVSPDRPNEPRFALNYHTILDPSENTPDSTDVLDGVRELLTNECADCDRFNIVYVGMVHELSGLEVRPVAKTVVGSLVTRWMPFTIMIPLEISHHTRPLPIAPSFLVARISHLDHLTLPDSDSFELDANIIPASKQEASLLLFERSSEINDFAYQPFVAELVQMFLERTSVATQQASSTSRNNNANDEIVIDEHDDVIDVNTTSTNNIIITNNNNNTNNNTNNIIIINNNDNNNNNIDITTSVAVVPKDNDGDDDEEALLAISKGAESPSANDDGIATSRGDPHEVPCV